MRGAMTHGLVHSGFMGELDKLWQNVTEHHGKHKDKVLHHRHSLGAAMATIATSRFESLQRSRIFSLLALSSRH